MKSLFKNHPDIIDVLDYETYCEDTIDELLQSLMFDNRYGYELDPEDESDAVLIDIGASHGFTRKGMNLINSLQRRYYNLGKITFPDQDIEIRIVGLIEE